MTYIYNNTGSSLSRPTQPEGWRDNTNELKKAIALVSSYYPTNRFEVTLLFWLMYTRNNAGIKRKQRTGFTPIRSSMENAKNIHVTVRTKTLRKAYAIVKNGLVAVLLLRDKQNNSRT